MTHHAYESPARVATYLEMEWSDWLLFSSAKAAQKSASPPAGPVNPIFYSHVVQFALRNIKSKKEPVRICDVGGSTGRLIFEWLRAFSNTDEAVLVEPSRAFCQWAKRLLLQSGPLGRIPIVRSHEAPGFSKPLRRPPGTASFSAANVCIHHGDAKSLPRADGYFDIVTCLNVADRVPAPSVLLSQLRRLLKKNGMLILASPMDWQHNKGTPKKKRFNNLHTLLPSTRWKLLDEANLDYAVRLTNRQALFYISEVIAASKLS